MRIFPGVKVQAPFACEHGSLVSFQDKKLGLIFKLSERSTLILSLTDASLLATYDSNAMQSVDGLESVCSLGTDYTISFALKMSLLERSEVKPGSLCFTATGSLFSIRHEGHIRFLDFSEVANKHKDSVPQSLHCAEEWSITFKNPKGDVVRSETFRAFA